MHTPTLSARERPEPRGAGVVGAALLAALLFGLLSVLPPLSIVSALAPFPLIVQRLRRGAFSALAAAGLAAALLAAAFSGAQAAGFLALLAAPGLLIGEAMARGRGLVRGCKWAFLYLGAVIGVLLLFAEPQMSELALAPLEQVRSPAFVDGLRSSGFPPDRVDELAEQFATFYTILQVVYPAALVILGALVVLANAAVLRLYLARRDPGWLDGGEFEELRWPLALAVTFVAAGLAVLAPALRPTAYNALLLVAFFFALEGLAVVAFYARRLAGPPLLRAAVVVLVLVNPWAPQLLALLGLFDIWFDFRKWARPPAGEGA